eukprot:TRINITY_DN68897_c0_g1_i3.p1 TRINITY_DN68897_c0_g1~~TRINITY_DN68897_c0_g1_i3.p1  ORF type:complete len:1066 (-),score=299.85 TRINITY_DN68897_c0_g1_i3:184-3381(-)
MEADDGGDPMGLDGLDLLLDDLSHDNLSGQVSPQSCTAPPLAASLLGGEKDAAAEAVRAAVAAAARVGKTPSERDEDLPLPDLMMSTEAEDRLPPASVKASLEAVARPQQHQKPEASGVEDIEEPSPKPAAKDASGGLLASAAAAGAASASDYSLASFHTSRGDSKVVVAVEDSLTSKAAASQPEQLQSESKLSFGQAGSNTDAAWDTEEGSDLSVPVIKVQPPDEDEPHPQPEDEDYIDVDGSGFDLVLDDVDSDAANSPARAAQTNAFAAQPLDAKVSQEKPKPADVSGKASPSLMMADSRESTGEPPSGSPWTGMAASQGGVGSPGNDIIFLEEDSDEEDENPAQPYQSQRDLHNLDIDISDEDSEEEIQVNIQGARGDSLDVAATTEEDAKKLQGDTGSSGSPRTTTNVALVDTSPKKPLQPDEKSILPEPTTPQKKKTPLLPAGSLVATVGKDDEAAPKSPRPGHQGLNASTGGSKSWTCRTCTLVNVAGSARCAACDSTAPAASPVVSPSQHAAAVKVTIAEKPPAAAAPAPKAQPSNTAAPSLLELMTMSVSEMESGKGPSPGKEATIDVVLPDAGTDEGVNVAADAKRAAASSASRLIRSEEKERRDRPAAAKSQAGHVFSRADPLADALKRSPPAPAEAMTKKPSDRSKEGGDERSTTAGSSAAATARTDALAALRKAQAATGQMPVAGAAARTDSTAPIPPAPSSQASPSAAADAKVTSTGAAEDAGMADEWAGVEERTAEMRKKREKEGLAVVRPEDDPMAKPISFREVQQWLDSLRVDQAVLQTWEDKQEEAEGGAGCGCFSKPRRASDVRGLNRKCSAEKDQVLYLFLVHFDYNDLVHFRMLRTIYTKLTRNKTCASIGSHWGVLGWQNTDVRMDVNRSGGVLNILHIFYFYDKYFDILKSAFLLSQDHEQHFPLCCVSINISQLVMEYFLAGTFSSMCNKDGVFETVCRMHAGGLHYFYMRWRTQKRSIRDTEKTMKEIRALMSSKPKKLLEELDKGVEEKKAKNDATRLEFTELDFGTARGNAPRAAPAQGKSAASAVPARLRNYDAGAE